MGWAHYALQQHHIRLSEFAAMPRRERLATIASCAVQMEEEERAYKHAKAK